LLTVGVEREMGEAGPPGLSGPGDMEWERATMEEERGWADAGLRAGAVGELGLCGGDLKHEGVDSNSRIQ
jgi:hypothetical protein